MRNFVKGIIFFLISCSALAALDTKNDKVLQAQISDKSYQAKCSFVDEKNKPHESTHYFYKGNEYFLFSDYSTKQQYYMVLAPYKVNQDKLSGKTSDASFEYNFKTKQYTSKQAPPFGTIVEKCEVLNDSVKAL